VLISGFFRVGPNTCGGCEVRFVGPTTFDSVAGANGRFSAGASGLIPPGTYSVYYECFGNYIPVDSPQQITLNPGSNVFDVAIGFCG
jgi:hypothetical protein